MRAENDIVERLRALSRCEHSDLSIGDEAAAEIVRLRGEVGSAKSLLDRACPHLLDEGQEYEDDGSNEPLELAREIEQFTVALPSDESALVSASLAFDGGKAATLAPAEAKVDALLAAIAASAASAGDYQPHDQVVSMFAVESAIRGAELDTPQPAGGEAVALTAWVGTMQASNGTNYYVCVGFPGGKYITPQVYDIRGRADYDVAEWKHMLGQGPKPDILAFDTEGATPPAAQVQQEARDMLRIVDTAIIVCNERDRPAMAESLEAVRHYIERAAHPSACELGAWVPADTLKVWRTDIDYAPAQVQAGITVMLEAALQHRGDSRGGEAGRG